MTVPSYVDRCTPDLRVNERKDNTCTVGFSHRRRHGALIAGCGGSDSSEDSASDSDDAATATVTAEDDSVDTAVGADDSGGRGRLG